jgi:MinD-like ATPase involved in chromosome partitioning or flagellar assembly
VTAVEHGATTTVPARSGDAGANLAVVAVTQLRGGPGGTTFALGLAAAAAEHGRSWLVEADPAGGVLLGRCDTLTGERTLVDVAFGGAAATSDVVALAEAAGQPLGHASVVVAPESPAQAFECVARPRLRWPAHLRRLPGRVVVDCGRLFPGSPAVEVLRRADVVVVVTPPDGGDVYRFLRWAHEGREVDAPLLVTSGPGRFGARAVARDVGDVYLGPIPSAPEAVDLLQRGASTTHRRLYRSDMVRALLARLQAIDAFVASAPRREPSP